VAKPEVIAALLLLAQSVRAIGEHDRVESGVLHVVSNPIAGTCDDGGFLVEREGTHGSTVCLDGLDPL
jgi:hypothetical protein